MPTGSTIGGVSGATLPPGWTMNPDGSLVNSAGATGVYQSDGTVTVNGKNSALPPGWAMNASGVPVNAAGQAGIVQPDGTVQVGGATEFASAGGGYFQGSNASTGQHVYDPTQQGGSTYWANGIQHQDTGNEIDMGAALVDPTSSDAQAYDYGGSATGAQDAVNRARGLEASVQQRAPVQANLANANADRGLQMQGAQGYQSMLAGGGPSIANQLSQQGIGAAGAGTMQAVAQARHGDMAGAQRSALLFGGGAARQAVMAGANQRLSEQQLAASGLASTAGAMQQQGISNALQQGGLAGQQSGLNDQAAMMYGNQANNVNAAQMAGANASQNAQQNLAQIGYTQNDTQQQQQYAAANQKLNAVLGATSTTLSAGGSLANSAKNNGSSTSGSSPNGQ